ncbi:MAG TPA: type III PLP-dependent enzyme [Verrucomicrobiae bacterium]|nr:type III PLP-dependent enzyme [Verrucomicrobiae bacterium]
MTDTFSPQAIKSHDYPTPFLMLDLDRVEKAYRVFADLLPDVDIHYAVKCNPDARILRRLHTLGCKFEIASYNELERLIAEGVVPADVLFSNPVKVPSHIDRAHDRGLHRFSFDSQAELDKITQQAPGAAVFVRIQTVAADSLVPCEGKFGIGNSEALRLMKYAKRVGLKPYGIAFHVGSLMHKANAWDAAIANASDLMRQLQKIGITIEMLDLGGGFPANYGVKVPSMKTFARNIKAALAQHVPYDVQIVIEPGRGMVGDAGVMVATVIGVATRCDKRWIHLDVGAFNGMMEALETQNTLIFPLSDSRNSPNKSLCHLTGPTCDSQDTILLDIELSDNLRIGDRVFIHTAGAYTTSYASTFNDFSLPDVYCINE